MGMELSPNHRVFDDFSSASLRIDPTPLVSLPRMLFGQFLLVLHMEHQIAAGDEFDDEKQSRIGLKTKKWKVRNTKNLKAGMEADEKRVVGGSLEHGFLRLDPIDVLSAENKYCSTKTNFSFVSFSVLFNSN